MTCLVSILKRDGLSCFREFVEIPHRPERGDLLRVLGAVCRVVSLVHETSMPADPIYEDLEIQTPDSFIEIIAAPVTFREQVAEIFQHPTVLEGGLQ